MIPSPRRAVRRIQELQAASLSRVPGKGYGADCPEEIAQRVWDSQGIRNRQCALMKGRACLTNLISFCDGGITWGVRERLLMWSASASAKPPTLCAMVFWRCCSLWPAQLHCVLGKELAGGPGLREARDGPAVLSTGEATA